MRSSITASLAAIALSLAVGARADDPAALADSLFAEGRKLANEQNDWAAACPKFAESHRLKPGGGVVLNLALCFRKIGKTASAYARFKEGRAFAVRDKNEARLAIANQAIAELEPVLSYLTLIVPPAADEPGLSIELDGQPIPRAAWGSRFAVDPGKREVVATAPKKKPFRTTVAVEDMADQKTVAIPALQPAPAGSPPSPQGDVVTIDHPGRRIAGFVSLGVGAVGLGVGTYFGVRALDAKSKSDDACVTGCTSVGADHSVDAVRYGNLSTASFALGFVGVAAGAYLVLTSTTTQLRAARVSVGHDHAILSFSTVF
ncbi:MAG: hypothetical protein HYV09_18350 [Deltaproteobacteria bacterium]|nr:hypothetical protein [Deltaproteobacteria bacterium]